MATIFQITDLAGKEPPLPAPATGDAPGQLRDSFGRAITDLRISVTDRCNFRCVYCRSADPEANMPESHLLTWDELERLARILTGLGIRKIRVTGGEPLCRPGVGAF